MTPNNLIGTPKKGFSNLTRARFGPGMLLQHDDLEQLNAYTRDLSRLLFRSFFGCGVICGLVVKVDEKCEKLCITVDPGVALDCCGDPIHVPTSQQILLDEDCHPDLGKELWVVLCGTAKRCAPRTAMCATDDDDAAAVCTREREGFEIQILKSRPPCACQCTEQALLNDPCKCANPADPCYKAHYDGECGCECVDGSTCDCDCVVLARLTKPDNKPWQADHKVRRFIRPLLMRDPQVEREKPKVTTKTKQFKP